MKITKKINKIFAIAVALAIFTASFSCTVNAENDALTNATANNSYADYSSEFGKLCSAESGCKVNAGVDITDKKSSLFNISISEDALYKIGLYYKPIDNAIVNITFDLKLDGKNPFDEAKRLTIPRIWKDSPFETDADGNQFVLEPKQSEDYCYHVLSDISGWTADNYLFYLTSGEHTVEITAVEGSFKLDYLVFESPETPQSYSAPKDKSEFYTGEDIVIEGEKALYKNSFWLSPSANTTSTKVSPKSPLNDVINFIGGSNWSKAGDTIAWETPEVKAGYYKIGFSYMQDSVIGGSVYRWLKVDGKTPFREAEEIPFKYCYDFENYSFSDSKGSPYLIYLTEGKHTISLMATPGKMQEVTSVLNSVTSLISDIYLDIIMITGQTIDTSRDYDLFNQVPDMENRLKKIYNGLLKSKNLLIKYTGNETGSHISVINGMLRVTNEMLDNKFYAHKYVTSFYSNYSSVAATLNELKSVPLSVDSITLCSPAKEAKRKDISVFEKISFSVKRFIYSFVKDYNGVSKEDNKTDSLEIWVNWGRDQAQVLNSLVQTSFIPEYKIPVVVKVVNASMVQAVLSGKGPDIFLQHSRSEPVNLAMRGVLYDISQFEDIDKVLKNFSPDADIPYRYKDGLYALPDTQTFYLMYYRKDIFEKLGLTVPKTWEEFARVSTQLSRENLYTWIPYTQITDMTQANTGVGSLSLFPSLVLQKGLSFYTKDQKSSTLTSEPMTRAFTEWTDYYTKMKLPVSMSFYNRFRTGDCPLGIDIYTTYTTLKAAASEIDGLWGVSELPGTVLKDGTVSHASSGGGTACGILKSTKNPNASWEFLKWWTSANVQLSFSNNVEAILGPSARVAVSNTDAFEGMSWDVDMRNDIILARSRVREIPEIPGSYYLSRGIDHCFWNVVNSNKKPKNMLLQWGAEVNSEIERKWEQYSDRK